MPGKENSEISQLAIERMKTLRRAKGLSAQSLAELVSARGFSISRSVIANLENRRGRDTMTVDEFCAFAEALGSTPEGLIGIAALCAACKDVPPPGFQCMECGACTVRSS